MPSGPAPAASSGSRRVWIIVAVAAGLLLLAACGAGAYLVLRATTDAPKPPTDETRIRKLVEDFATAVDRAEQSAILNLLCAAEVEELVEDDDFDPSQAPPVDPPSVSPVTVADIRVSGDIASARVTRPSQPVVTLHFRKENGAWRVCAPAGDPAQPSASGGPPGP